MLFTMPWNTSAQEITELHPDGLFVTSGPGDPNAVKETVETIRAYQPDAIIFLCANMHVTEEQSAKDAIYNNTNVNRVNGMISELADNETIFYIDVNEVFDDAGGNLDAAYSCDAFHVYGKHYQTWVDWLCTKAII